MAFFWDHYVSSKISALGYDIGTQTLAVVFPGGRTVYHSPVPYTLYASIFHASSLNGYTRIPLRRKFRSSGESQGHHNR